MRVIRRGRIANHRIYVVSLKTENDVGFLPTECQVLSYMLYFIEHLANISLQAVDASNAVNVEVQGERECVRTLLFGDMVHQSVVNQFRSCADAQFFEDAGAIGTHCLDAERKL